MQRNRDTSNKKSKITTEVRNSDYPLTLPRFFNNGSQHHVRDVIKLEGGLTNETYLVKTASHEFVTRIPGAGTSDFISREDESRNTKIAQAAGITPEVVYEESSGLKVTSFLSNPLVMHKQSIKKPEYLLMMVDTLRRLHASEPFSNHVDIFQRMRDLIELLNAKAYTLPGKYAGVVERMNEIELLVGQCEIDLAPCHNDAGPGNFIFSAGKMYVIDFEYAGNNDPVWDLAYLATEADLTIAQGGFLLRAYFGDALTDDIRYRFHLYQPVVHCLSALWCHQQIACNNLARSSDVFEKMERQQFFRCADSLASDTFSQAFHSLNSLAEEVVYDSDSDIAQPGKGLACCKR